VRRLAVRLAAVAAVGGLAVAATTALLPVERARVLDGYVLFAGGLLLILLVHATRTVSPSGARSLYERALVRPRQSTARPRDLAKLEREVVLGASTAFDFHMRLRPLLREIAAYRLASRRGLDLASGSGDVRAVLGDDLWELVRPDAAPPDDRLAPGLPLPRLGAAVDTLERI